MYHLMNCICMSVYLCICVFVYLCICVFVHLCICAFVLRYSALASSPLFTRRTPNGPSVMLQLVSTITQVTTCHRNPEKMDGEINVFWPKKSRKGQKNVFRNQQTGFKSQVMWLLLMCFVRVEFLV